MRKLPPEELNLRSINALTRGLKPGMRLSLKGVPEAVYHHAEGIGSTLLKAATKSMAHYKAKLEEEDDRSPAALKAMAIGSATHCLVLEPESYPDKFVTQPADIKVRNGAKWEVFKASATDKEILTVADEELASAMADAVLESAGRFFLEGIPETSWWYRHESGALLKARVDYLIGDAIIDLKTTKHEVPAQFRKAVKYEYDMQDALYRLVTGLPDMIFVGVGKTRPYPVFLCRQGAMVRERATKDMLAAINAIQQAEEFEQYPNIPVELTETELTAMELAELEVSAA